MSGTSIMKLLDYKVLKTNFQLSDKFKFNNQKIDIKHDFTRNVQKIDEDKYALTMGFQILEENNEKPIPFNVEVLIAGVFELKSWEEPTNKEMAINNATAILFPYLRSLVSSVTLNGNVAPYVLPVMNIVELFKEQKI